MPYIPADQRDTDVAAVFRGYSAMRLRHRRTVLLDNRISVASLREILN